jgi:hypothetical protein
MNFVSASDHYSIAATLRAMPEAPQLDFSWSLDSFTTNFFENCPRTHQEWYH